MRTIPFEVFMTKKKPKQSKAKGGGRRGRFSARKKAEAVRRLVAGEELDARSRRKLGQWEAPRTQPLARGVLCSLLPGGSLLCKVGFLIDSDYCANSFCC